MANGPLPVDRHTPNKDASADFAANMPWWVRAIAIIGIPGVLVIYLVYVGAQELPAIRRQVDQNTKEILQNREMIREQILQHEASYRMLQRLCSNSAKTDDERARCFER